MPELPEVEVNRRGLDRLVKGKIISGLSLYWPRIIVAYSEQANWEENIKNKEIIKVKRRGKYLIFQFIDGFLLSHLRMEGKYFFFNKDEIPIEKDKHTHVIIHFTDGSELHYNDVRKFGRMEYIADMGVENYFETKAIGPEPVADSFSRETFGKQLAGVKQVIKAALLSQKYVAGLGNIYVDEVLFAAKVHPSRQGNNLNSEEIDAIYEAILDIMQRAIEAGGSTIRSYTNTVGQAGFYQEQLQVYGKKGQACPRCQTTIEKIKIAQRGTHYCPNCQEVNK